MRLDLILSPETAALRDALLDVPLGGEIAWKDLSAVIGRDVRGPAAARLASARRIALRESGAAFQTIRGVGLRRLKPEDAPELGRAARGRIARTARRGLRGMTAMTEAGNGLPPEAQRRLTAEASALGLIAHIARQDATDAMATDDRPMPPARASEAFLRHIGALPPEPAKP